MILAYSILKLDKLVKPDEEIPNSIRIIQTDKKFLGDCRVEIECRNCGFGVALTAFEVLCNMMMFGRIDGNNPRYGFGRKYIWKYFEICHGDNRLYLEANIRSRIIKELIEDGQREL